MVKSLSSRSGKTTYNINGVEYQSIDEVPAEYRAIISEMEKNPPKDSKITVTKQNYVLSNLSDAAKELNQEKFLQKVVLPNLHLMDDRAKGKVLKELHGIPGTPKGIPSPIHPLIWIALGATISIVMIMLLAR